jgi:hypothetical protein
LDRRWGISWERERLADEPSRPSLQVRVDRLVLAAKDNWKSAIPQMQAFRRTGDHLIWRKRPDLFLPYGRVCTYEGMSLEKIQAQYEARSAKLPVALIALVPRDKCGLEVRDVIQMAAWLATFHWDLFCTLTFRPYFTTKQRQALMQAWIAAVKGKYGQVNWFAVPQLGRTGEDYHYHILIGGLPDLSAHDRLELMNLWTCGDAQITEYRPGENGIAYILREAGPETDIEFEISERGRMQSSFGE